MRDNHVISLLKDNYQVLGVSYSRGYSEPIPRGPASNGRTYQFKAPKDVEFKVGDAVIVPNDSDDKPYTVVYVVRVEPNEELEFELEVDFKWIVSKVDTAKFDTICAEEAELRSKMNLARKQKLRADLRQTLLAQMPELNVVEEVKHG